MCKHLRKQTSFILHLHPPVCSLYTLSVDNGQSFHYPLIYNWLTNKKFSAKRTQFIFCLNVLETPFAKSMVTVAGYKRTVIRFIILRETDTTQHLLPFPFLLLRERVVKDFFLLQWMQQSDYIVINAFMIFNRVSTEGTLRSGL